MISFRNRPVLSQGEWEILGQVAGLTHTKRTEVVENALAV